MGPLMVEDGAEAVEASLLTAEVLGRGAGGGGLQRSVHALVSSVLLGPAGLDAFRSDAQLHPVDGERGERPPSPTEDGKGWPLPLRMTSGMP